MLKLLAVIGLVIVSAMPNSNIRESLENKLISVAESDHKSIERQTPNPLPTIVEKKDGAAPIAIGAKAAYFFDPKSGQIYYSKNETQKLPMASISKLMTAVVIVKKHQLDEMVTITKIRPQSGDALAGFKMGETVTISDLLHGLLLPSGSDAALALAAYSSGSPEAFTAEMNETALILGLTDTQFSNPVGWDTEDNYATAKDLAILTNIALTNPEISKIVTKKSYQTKTKAGRIVLMKNTNLLLGSGYLGAKTGTTNKAGECLATYYKDDQKEVVGVILNSPDRFTETKKIINWISRSYLFDMQKDSN